jgi:crossover junction endodeoxyribonuclease RusA
MSEPFFVQGVPVAKGSGRAFYNPKAGRAYVVQTNAARQKPFASMISYTAQEHGITPINGPVFVGMLFQFPRPKAHYRGKAKTLRDNAPIYHVSTPDVDKCARLVLDSLTGIAWHDDKQAQITEARKIYSDTPGVWITVSDKEKNEHTA